MSLNWYWGIITLFALRLNAKTFWSTNLNQVCWSIVSSLPRLAVFAMFCVRCQSSSGWSLLAIYSCIKDLNPGLWGPGPWQTPAADWHWSVSRSHSGDKRWPSKDKYWSWIIKINPDTVRQCPVPDIYHRIRIAPPSVFCVSRIYQDQENCLKISRCQCCVHFVPACAGLMWCLSVPHSSLRPVFDPSWRPLIVDPLNNCSKMWWNIVWEDLFSALSSRADLHWKIFHITFNTPWGLYNTHNAHLTTSKNTRLLGIPWRRIVKFPS